MSAFAAARGINSYRQMDVQARTPLELVVMLYDGALRFCGQAREALVQRDIPRRRQAVNRALDIVFELQNTLNMEEGGKLSQDLDALYSYVRDRLIDASIKQDVKPVDEAIRILTTLREGWAGISAAQQQPTAGAR
jgi:flagellar protein FliS